MFINKYLARFVSLVAGDIYTWPILDRRQLPQGLYLSYYIYLTRVSFPDLLILTFLLEDTGLCPFYYIFLLVFLMELLSYANRNLAEHSKSVLESLFPTSSSTTFAETESFLPIAMIPELNTNHATYYLLDGESFATPNRSVCAEEYDHLVDSHMTSNHHIPTVVKSEYDYIPNEVGNSENFHYQHVPEVPNARFLPLQDMSHPNSGIQSPLLIKKDRYSVQYTLDSHLRDSVYQDPDVLEAALQSTQCLLSLQLGQRSENYFHSNVNSAYHYKDLGGVQQYPDITTMVNSNTNMVAPMVETTFIDHKVCNVCGRRITRDMTRHMRTHQVIKRFVCDFPKGSCRHRSGQFNRRYDFKKHLLNNHFVFDDQNVKKVHNLKGKLDDWGTCHCGRRFVSSDWLDNHILTEDHAYRCPLMYE